MGFEQPANRDRQDCFQSGHASADVDHAAKPGAEAQQKRHRSNRDHILS